MMIGTRERARSSRHTSIPEIFGSITSRSTSAGRAASKRSIASGPSAAVSTRKPSRCSATASASRYDCSSSTTRIRGGSAIIPPSVRFRVTARAAVRERDVERERRTLAFARLHGDLAAVRLRDVAHDRETEPGPTGVASARAIDAVEALPDAFEIARRDPDSVVTDDERHALVDQARADLHGLFGAGVLDRVVEQVDERAPQLARIAEDLDVGRLGPEEQRHRGRVRG